MPLIDRRTPNGSRTPADSVYLDMSQPSAAGLLHCWPFFMAETPNKIPDLLGKRNLSRVSNSEFVRSVDAFGPNWDTKNNSGYPGFSGGSDLLDVTDEITVSFWFNSRYAGGFSDATLLSRAVSGTAANDVDNGTSDITIRFQTGNYIEAMIRTIGNDLALRVGDDPGEDPWGGVHTQSSNSGARGPFYPDFVAITYKTTELRLYVNGVQVGSATDGSAGDIQQETGRIFGFFGPYYFGSSDRLGSHAVYEARVYNRCLNSAGIWRLYDPQTRWEIYQNQRIFYTVSTPLEPGTTGQNVIWFGAAF